MRAAQDPRQANYPHVPAQGAGHPPGPQGADHPPQQVQVFNLPPTGHNQAGGGAFVPGLAPGVRQATAQRQANAENAFQRIQQQPQQLPQYQAPHQAPLPEHPPQRAQQFHPAQLRDRPAQQPVAPTGGWMYQHSAPARVDAAQRATSGAGSSQSSSQAGLADDYVDDQGRERPLKRRRVETPNEASNEALGQADPRTSIDLRGRYFDQVSRHLTDLKNALAAFHSAVDNGQCYPGHQTSHHIAALRGACHKAMQGLLKYQRMDLAGEVKRKWIEAMNRLPQSFSDEVQNERKLMVDAPPALLQALTTISTAYETFAASIHPTLTQQSVPQGQALHAGALQHQGTVPSANLQPQPQYGRDNRFSNSSEVQPRASHMSQPSGLGISEPGRSISSTSEHSRDSRSEQTYQVPDPYAGTLHHHGTVPSGNLQPQPQSQYGRDNRFSNSSGGPPHASHMSQPSAFGTSEPGRSISSTSERSRDSRSEQAYQVPGSYAGALQHHGTVPSGNLQPQPPRGRGNLFSNSSGAQAPSGHMVPSSAHGVGTGGASTSSTPTHHGYAGQVPTVQVPGWPGQSTSSAMASTPTTTTTTTTTTNTGGSARPTDGLGAQLIERRSAPVIIDLDPSEDDDALDEPAIAAQPQILRAQPAAPIEPVPDVTAATSRLVDLIGRVEHSTDQDFRGAVNELTQMFDEQVVKFAALDLPNAPAIDKVKCSLFIKQGLTLINELGLKLLKRAENQPNRSDDYYYYLRGQLAHEGSSWKYLNRIEDVVRSGIADYSTRKPILKITQIMVAKNEKAKAQAQAEANDHQ